MILIMNLHGVGIDIIHPKLVKITPLLQIYLIGKVLTVDIFRLDRIKHLQLMKELMK